jgi:hypothetical protein
VRVAQNILRPATRNQRAEGATAASDSVFRRVVDEVMSITAATAKLDRNGLRIGVIGNDSYGSSSAGGSV